MSMKITTPDGIVISVVVEGAGPPLILVTGSGDDYTRYGRVSPILGKSYTLYNVDRRGRGDSTDDAAYSFLGEVNDLLAVIDAIHAEAGPAHLLAHSYGGLVGLEVAWRTDKLKSVLLYEPPMPFYERIDGVDPRKPLVLEMIDLLAKGKVDEMLTFYIHDFMGLPLEAVERQKSNPKAWGRWLSVANTIPRELLTVRDYEFAPYKFASVKRPMGVMVGGNSRGGMRNSAQRIKAGIPQTEIIELPGEGHSAMTSSPEMFASAVLAFFNSAN
jgi:pimeloyl-ACP methyl ester carboxylesterase